MFTFGWSQCCILLTLHLTAYGLETFEYDSHEVLCSQGLSECTLEDEIPLNPRKDTVTVQNLKPDFKLCCSNNTTCALCLIVDIELYIHTDENMEEQDSSGSEEEEYNEEKSNSKGSVTLCYHTETTIPACNKVEFTVNHAGLALQNQTKISVVITNPGGFPFGSHLIVYTSNTTREVVAPSFDEVCLQNLQRTVSKCQVPKFHIVINQEKNQVELQFDGKNKTLPLMCVQYEKDGRCQSWNRKTIPLHSVTPCTCLQVWNDDDQMSTRSLRCPFNKNNVTQKNLWDNVTVSAPQKSENNYGTMLSWNVSAPCRLDGEVWLSDRNGINCRAFRQQLASGTAWKQNSTGYWVKTCVFTEISDQPLPCMKMRLTGMTHDLGPFCFDPKPGGRWYWGLLVVAVMLLVCLTALMHCYFHKSVKKWVWSWRHGGIVKIGRNNHVVLLSPPDVDDGVSELVCQLGSFLSNQGFSVTVDQWSRKEQCTLGPLPWLHSQLLELNSLGGRVLLILTQKALERTEEWIHWNKAVIKEGMERKESVLPLLWSPYSDLFTASLFRIQADKLQGRAGDRFLLVKFDSHSTQIHSSDRSLPELLQGLPLFKFPFQRQSLLAELTVMDKERGSRASSSRTQVF